MMGVREQEEILFLPVRPQLPPANLPLPLGTTRSGQLEGRRTLASWLTFYVPVPQGPPYPQAGPPEPPGTPGAGVS